MSRSPLLGLCGGASLSPNICSSTSSTVRPGDRDTALRASVTMQVKALWLVSAVCLAGSMVLAALYGSRFHYTISWLDIPWMRAVHGSANALGFGLAGLVGWWLRR